MSALALGRVWRAPARAKPAGGGVRAADAEGLLFIPGGFGAVGLLAVWQEPARPELAGSLAGWLVQPGQRGGAAKPR